MGLDDGIEKDTSVHSDEKSFLAKYDINKYDRPSVATDIVAFTIETKESLSQRKPPDYNLKVLLVQRGEHPFKNQWALPGGFLRKDETVEECALREIKEETNVTPNSIVPIGVFSEPNRDPRGRIISISFMSVISEQNIKLSSKGDAIKAKWFDVSLVTVDENQLDLTLKNESAYLTARLTKIDKSIGQSVYKVVENNDVAFDHAEIIANAIFALRKEAEDYNLAFSLLPELFTLNALQKVQEALTGELFSTPNFRRKTSDYVVETDEFVNGPRHRPARLYKRKLERK